MKNKLAPMLKEAKRNGVEQGLYLMSQITLIALENVVNDWDLPISNHFFKDVEKEMGDIYKQVIESVPSGNSEEMAERLSFYVDEIRERRGMDDSQRIESDRTD